MTDHRTAEWPREHAERLDALHPRRDRDARVREEVKVALSKIDDRAPAVAAVSRWLGERAQAGGRMPDAEELGTAISDALHRAGLPDEAEGATRAGFPIDELLPDVTPTQAALVAKAAFHLFGEAGDEAAWRVVDAVRHVSDRTWSAVSSCLDRALADPGLRARLLGVAETFVDRILDDPTTLVAVRSRELLARMFENWRSGPKLFDLWFGVRDLGFVDSFGGDLSMLGGLARAEPRFVVNQLGRFDVPHPVVVVVEGTGAERRFATWAPLASAAPPAFEVDGRWTGSPVLPALLASAERACRDLPPVSRENPSNSADAARGLMDDVVRAAAAVVHARADGAAASFRWASWLVRSFMAASAEVGGDPTHPHHRGFPQWALANALADGSHGAWSGLSAPDDADEAWFGHMARILAATREPTPGPGLADLWTRFATDWPGPQDDPDQWIGSSGARLRTVSSVIRTFSRRLGGVGVGTLAIPLAATRDPASEWRALWRRCLVLREQVEFAEFDLTTSHDDERTGAAELSRVAFDLGLSAFDRLLAEEPAGTDRLQAAADLLSPLWDASREMAAIDRFGPDIWASAQRNLAVRRVALADDPRIATARRRLPSTTEPTLARMLGASAGVDAAFFATLRAVLSNDVPVEMIGEALAEAKVDLLRLLEGAERANRIDDRRTVTSAEELARLRTAFKGLDAH